MKQDFQRNAFWRYAKWADTKTDDYNEPLLYSAAKMLAFLMLPMLLMIALFMFAVVVIIAVAIQVVPWIWNLVWI